MSATQVLTPLSLRPTAAVLRISDLLLLLVAMVWGTSYGVAKGALLFYPVLGFLAVRFLLTFALLLPVLLKGGAQQCRAALASGVPLGTLLLGIFLCETFGVAMTQAANAAFLISLCVVFTPFSQWWLLKRRPSIADGMFAAVSLLGAALLSGGLQASLGWGDALILLAAALRAVITCLTVRFNQRRTVPALALTAVQAAVVGFACLGLALAAPQGLPALPSLPAFWFSALYLVLGCTIFALFAQNWALRHSEPTRVALLMGSEPVFGALFAVLWLGESLGTLAWLGGGLIVAASLWASLRR